MATARVNGCRARRKQNPKAKPPAKEPIVKKSNKKLFLLGAKTILALAAAGLLAGAASLAQADEAAGAADSSGAVAPNAKKATREPNSKGVDAQAGWTLGAADAQSAKQQDTAAREDIFAATPCDVDAACAAMLQSGVVDASIKSAKNEDSLAEWAKGRQDPTERALGFAAAAIAFEKTTTRWGKTTVEKPASVENRVEWALAALDAEQQAGVKIATVGRAAWLAFVDGSIEPDPALAQSVAKLARALPKEEAAQAAMGQGDATPQRWLTLGAWLANPDNPLGDGQLASAAFGKARDGAQARLDAVSPSGDKTDIVEATSILSQAGAAQTYNARWLAGRTQESRKALLCFARSEALIKDKSEAALLAQLDWLRIALVSKKGVEEQVRTGKALDSKA
jgi:hypothetical protein